MDYSSLQKLGDRAYFTCNDVAQLFGIQVASARVLCARNAATGAFVRLKRNFYVLDQHWRRLSTPESLRIANFLQVPSYVSFMTALSRYELTTQVQRDFVESASVKRSVRYGVRGRAFNYYKLNPACYFGFVKEDNLFIATPEKAFVDAIYLYSFGKYRMDFSSVDIERLDKERLREIVAVFPERTRRIVERTCRI